MPSTVEQLSPTRVKLTIEIPFADLKPAIAQIGSQITVPGFRKGKVPAAVINQRVGRGAVLQDAINEAIPQAYAAAVAELDLAHVRAGGEGQFFRRNAVGDREVD